MKCWLLKRLLVAPFKNLQSNAIGALHQTRSGPAQRSPPSPTTKVSGLVDKPMDYTKDNYKDLSPSPSPNPNPNPRT